MPNGPRFDLTYLQGLLLGEEGGPANGGDYPDSGDPIFGRIRQIMVARTS